MRSCRLSVVALAASSAAAFTLVPASDPRVWYSGRFLVNADGSRTFDWEASSFYINVAGATEVRAIVSSANSGATTRLQTSVLQTAPGYPNWMEASTTWVTPTGSSNITVVAGLATNANYTVRVFNTLEPAYEGGSAGGGVVFSGFLVNGEALPASPPISRRIQFVGDSITAGYGSIAQGPCKAETLQCSNYNTWNRYLCSNFTANCTVIAWSGKGMFENCCDSGERMPQYYLQTLGSSNYDPTWSFNEPAPTAMVINLGTNDFGHDNGTAWEAAFTATYVQFMSNVTRLYNEPNIHFFVAQGPMNDSPQLYNSLQAAITQHTAAGGLASFLDMRGAPTDGCGGHPGIQGHQVMADMAQPQIAKVMGW